MQLFLNGNLIILCSPRLFSLAEGFDSYTLYWIVYISTLSVSVELFESQSVSLDNRRENTW